MANVNELFDEMQKEKSYYVEDKDSSTGNKAYTPNVEGNYLGHITDVETRIVEFKGFKARVYNFKVKVAKGNSAMKYQRVEINGGIKEIDGTPFIGRVFRSTGVFRFLEPGEKDAFKSNSSGNRGYLSLCRAIDKECKVVTQTIDDKEVELKELPSLSESDLQGMPVIATVKSGKPYKDKNGVSRHYFDVKWVNRWKEGTKREDVDNDEIPF